MILRTEKGASVDSCKQTQYEMELVKPEMRMIDTFKHFLKKIWDGRSSITVEPFIFCYVLPSALTAVAVQELCLDKACLVNMGYNETVCSNLTSYKEEMKKVHSVTSWMNAWSSPLQSALPGILLLFAGAWSDRTGRRKTFMVLPILGKLLSIVGILLCTVFFFQMGVTETALIEAVLPAVTGGRVAMMAAVYSYVTDATTDADRTLRLGIITALISLTKPLGSAVSGIAVKNLGYYGVFMIACMFYLIGFMYILVRVKEKKKKTMDGENNSMLTMFSVNDLKSTVTVAVRKRQGSRRLQLFLILLAYMLIVGPVLGEAQMTYLFTRNKLNFGIVDLSLYLSYSVAVGTIGSFITIYLFTKQWKMEDGVIGLFACMGRIAASSVQAFAETREVYYMGPLLDMFSCAGATALRSIATKLVDSDEVGKTSSLISISEALVPSIYSPLYSMVYNAFIVVFPGAFYLISCFLAIPAAGILVTLLILHRKEAQDSANEEKNCENIEKYKPKETEVTRF